MYKTSLPLRFPYLLFVLSSLSVSANAETPSDQADDNFLFPDRRGVFSASLENDLVAGEDNNYTNGVRFSWFSSEVGVPGWMERSAEKLPFFDASGNKRYGFSLGQSMFTPTDIERRSPDSRDRPYAGWTYGTVGLVSDRSDRMDSLQLQLGIVGPASLAGQTQDFVHDLIGSPDPQGWDNQINNEPGIALMYQRKWRFLAETSPGGFGVDALPHIGGALGNVFTHANAGFTVRVGQDLGADYGPPLIQPSLPGSDFFNPSQAWGWYLFAGLDGRAVARNIFLDGNTFEDSPSVNKNPLVGDAQFGLAFTYETVRVAYTHVFRTKEFEGQRDPDSFGALTLSYRY
jgi:hypothetical protein